MIAPHNSTIEVTSTEQGQYDEKTSNWIDGSDSDYRGACSRVYITHVKPNVEPINRRSIEDGYPNGNCSCHHNHSTTPKSRCGFLQ
jgi:hypothetical protein